MSFIEFCYACLPVLNLFKTLLLLPIFQRTFVVFVTRFLNGSAKVGGFAFQPTFSETFFQIFFQTLIEDELNFLLENYPENLLKNYRFFSFAGCKDKGGHKHQPNFFKGYFSPNSITQYSIAFAVKKNWNQLIN